MNYSAAVELLDNGYDDSLLLAVAAADQDSNDR